MIRRNGSVSFPSPSDVVCQNSHFEPSIGGPSAADAIESDGVSRSRRYQKWSCQRIIEQILARRQAGKPLNYKTVKNDQRTLLVAARKHFANWNNALAIAGVISNPSTRLHPKPPPASIH
jgi:hypothetical protein